MIQNNFTRNCLTINVRKVKPQGSETEQFVLMMSSDYSGSSRKSSLHVNEKSLAEDVERLWKGIKTKKLLDLMVFFDEIDWYDDMTNMYTTPTASIKRGLRKAKIQYHQHGSIPKEWSFELRAHFSLGSTVAPIMEVIKASLSSSVFTAEVEKKFKKELLRLLKGEHVSYQFDDDDAN